MGFPILPSQKHTEVGIIISYILPLRDPRLKQVDKLF